MVRCNDIDQPVGKEAKHLGDFLGSVARNGSLCCLSYKDWRLLKTKTNVKAILDQVKVKFNPFNILYWLVLCCLTLHSPYLCCNCFVDEIMELDEKNGKTTKSGKFLTTVSFIYFLD